MPYIDATKAKQIVAIAKDYLGTTYLKFVQGAANGCYAKNSAWTDLLCFYQLYRQAGHRVDDLINDETYQKIIIKLLGKVALTPNYSLATCNNGVIIANGGCGCSGGSSTTGPVTGCVDSTLPFTMIFGATHLSTPVLIGVDILIAIREGVVMSTNPLSVNGFQFDNVLGVFVPNSPISPAGEDFIILYRNCNAGSGTPIPPTGLPDDIEFKIGVTGGLTPAIGSLTYTNVLIASRLIRLERSGLEQTLIGYAGGEGYTTPDAGGIINVVPAWVDQEYVKIQIYK